MIMLHVNLQACTVCFWCPNTSSPAVGKGNIYPNPSAYLRVWVLPTPKTIGSRAVNVCSLVKRQIFFNQKKQNQPTKKDSALCRSSECGGKDLSFVVPDQSLVIFLVVWDFDFSESFHCSDDSFSASPPQNKIGSLQTKSLKMWINLVENLCLESNWTWRNPLVSHISVPNLRVCWYLLTLKIHESLKPKGDHAGPRPWDQTLTNWPLSYMNHQEGRQKQQRLPRNHLSFFVKGEGIR